MADAGVAFSRTDGPEVASGTRQKLAKVFLERSIRALHGLSDAAPADVLENALQAPTDVGGVAVLLSELAPLGLDLSAIDPLAEAIARSALEKQELLQEPGGAYTATQVSTILGISRQAVEQCRRRNKLLAVPLGTGERVYPVCQFTAEGVLRGVEPPPPFRGGTYCTSCHYRKYRRGFNRLPWRVSVGDVARLT